MEVRKPPFLQTNWEKGTKVFTFGLKRVAKWFFFTIIVVRIRSASLATHLEIGEDKIIVRKKKDKIEKPSLLVIKKKLKKD